MDQNIYELYSMITGGEIPPVYKGPEAQGRYIRKCTLLREVEIEYSNSTSYTPDVQSQTKIQENNT